MVACKKAHSRCVIHELCTRKPAVATCGVSRELVPTGCYIVTDSESCWIETLESRAR